MKDDTTERFLSAGVPVDIASADILVLVG